MRSFLSANDRFFRPISILNGPATRAVIQPASDTPIINDQFLSPKQTLRVRPDSLVRSGQVIVYNNDHYLLGDFSTTSEWRTHIMLHCDRQVDWTRETTAIDPTTGLQKTNGAAALEGQPWVYWERVLRAPYDETTRLPNIDYIVATGAAVLKTDLIGGRSIVRFDQALGLTILGLKE